MHSTTTIRLCRGIGSSDQAANASVPPRTGSRTSPGPPTGMETVTRPIDPSRFCSASADTSNQLPRPLSLGDGWCPSLPVIAARSTHGLERRLACWRACRSVQNGRMSLLVNPLVGPTSRPAGHESDSVATRGHRAGHLAEPSAGALRAAVAGIHPAASGGDSTLVRILRRCPASALPEVRRGDPRRLPRHLRGRVLKQSLVGGIGAVPATRSAEMIRTA